MLTQNLGYMIIKINSFYAYHCIVISIKAINFNDPIFPLIIIFKKEEPLINLIYNI